MEAEVAARGGAAALLLRDRPVQAERPQALPAAQVGRSRG